MTVWACPAGDPDAAVLVLDLVDHEYARAVLATPDPARSAARLAPADRSS